MYVCYMSNVISVKGVIGSYTDPSTGQEVKGMELADLANQLHTAALEPTLVLEIDSPGGDKELGFEFYNLLKAQKKPIHALITGDCCSIATVILFAGETRELGPTGKPPMIHNPWFMAVSGDADAMAYASEVLRLDEEELINFYNKNTGVEKSLIASLMKVETFMTIEQASLFNFITTKQATLRAVAFNNKRDMNKETLSVVNKIYAMLNIGTKAKALMLTDSTGAQLETNSEGEIPVIGDTVMIGGAPVTDGTYVLTDLGLSIIVAAGVITDVITDNAMVDTVALKAELAEEKTKNAAFAAEIEALKNAQIETDKVLNAVAVRLGTNSFTPPPRTQSFAKPEDVKVDKIAEKNARRASYKK